MNLAISAAEELRVDFETAGAIRPSANLGDIGLCRMFRQ